MKDKPLVLSYKLDTLEYTGNKICVGCYKEIPLAERPPPIRKSSNGLGRRKPIRNKNDNNQSKPEQRTGNHGRDHDRKAKVKREMPMVSSLSSSSLPRQDKVEEVEEVKVESGSNENDDEQKENDDGRSDHDSQNRAHQKNDENSSSSRKERGKESSPATKKDGEACNESEEEYDEADDDDDEDSEDEDDDNDESDESDNSENEDNDAEDDDEEEKVCLSCHLPICSPACSAQYFHKNFECKLLREAIGAGYYQDQQQQHNKQLQQQHQHNLELSSGPTTATTSAAEQEEKCASGEKAEGTKEALEESDGSNQESMSPGTTCAMVVAGSVAAAASRCITNNNNMMCSPGMITSSNNKPSGRGRTSLSNGIREALLRNLLYFRCLLLKHVNEGHWNELISLQSNEEGRRSDMVSLEKTTRIFTLIKKTLAEINHPTWSHVFKPDVHKLVGIVEINALHISISQNVEVTGIFPTFSLMEHSCIPSVKYYLVPTTTPASTLSASATLDKEASHLHNQKKSGKASTFFELYCRSAVKLKSRDFLNSLFDSYQNICVFLRT